MTDIYARNNKPLKGTDFRTPGRITTLFGVFSGFVKDNTDVQLMGRLKVWIPEFGSAPDNVESWITASYCSPFAGATNPNLEDNNNVQSFEGTQTSYGMWMIPPDLENQVLIMFINGDPSKAIWIGSLYQQYMNEMIPAMAASTNNYQYGATNTSTGYAVPLAEYNKWDATVTNPQSVRRPYEKTKFKGLGNQGLITDPVRGITGTTARREAPSQVYGILTPGPLQQGTTTARRMGGSSFVMDDGVGSEYIQLSTKTGAQIKIDETNGFIFLINRDGTAWIQMDQAGNIDIFGATNISMRAQKDINFRADRNINIEAGQNVFIKAAADTTQTTTQFTYDVNGANITKTIPYWSYEGEGQGEGGNIVIQALNDLHTTIKNNAFITIVDNNLEILANNSLAVTTNTGGQDFNSNKGIKLTTGGALDIAASSKIRMGSGSDISISAQGALTLCSQSNFNLNSDADILINGGSSFQVGSPTIILSGTTVGINGGGATIIAEGGTIDFNAGSVNTPAKPGSPDGAQSAGEASPAEIKPLNDKINILPTWKTSITYQQWQANVAYPVGSIVINNSTTYEATRSVPAMATFNVKYWQLFVPIDKFVRDAEALQTTVSRLATFEPCPENPSFTLTTIAGYTPIITKSDLNYGGSGGPGNTNMTAPPDDNTPATTNTSVKGDGPDANATSTDINLATLQCQLSVNEGVKYTSYLDSRGLATGGIGHLLTKPTEIAQYPVPTAIPESVVTQWFQNDIGIAIKGAQTLIGLSVWGSLNDVRKRALADLTYNLGQGGLAKFPMFLAAMKAGNYTEAGAQLTNSAWYKQVGQRGPRIVQMITTGTDPLNWCLAAGKS
jgi:GH24 family phage-related lysozyme (muramidase)